MKHTICTAALCLALGAAAPAMAGIPEDGEGLTGLYGGSYLCADGEHGLILEIAILRPRGTPGVDRSFEVQGELGFFPVLGGAGGTFADVAGRFDVSGVLNTDGSLILRSGAWSIQPYGYGAAGVNGTLSQRADGLWQITGSPADGAHQCTGLIATRVAP